MKLVNKLSRHLMFAAVLSGLVIYVSCKGEIDGTLPGFEFPPVDNPIEFDASVDTTQIKAEDITVTASSISNEAAADMASSLSQATTPEAQAELANVSTQVDAVVLASQKSFFENKTSAEIRSGVETKNTTMVTNINNVRNAIANNPTLSEYLPAIDQPSGRVTSANRVGGEIALINVPSEVNALNAEITSCLEAYEEWATAERAKLKTAYDASNGLITTAYNREKGKLDSKKTEMLTAFQITYNDRISYFIGLWTTTASNVNAALTAGRISSGVAQDILLWNNIILAINVYFAFDLYQAEIALVNSNYNSALSKLNTARDTVKAGLNTRYQAALKEITDYLIEMTADCHDQGSHDQGGN